MKKIFLILGCAGIICMLTSFRLNPAHSYYSAGTHIVYYQPDLQTYFPGFIPRMSVACDASVHEFTTSGLLNPVVLTSLNTATPGVGLGMNGYTEIGASLTVNPDPDVAATTTRWTPNAFNVYNEFDTYVNRNFALQGDFTNGSGGVDRASVLRHEYGHGQGLGHSDDVDYLMHAEPDLSYERAPDEDMGRGYRCLYQNIDCQYDDDNPGSIDGAYDVDAFIRLKRDFQQFVLKSSPLINEEITAVNFLQKKKGNHVYKTINQQNLLFGSDGLLIYNFSKFDRSVDYYVEIVYKNFTSTIHEIKKRNHGK